MFCGKASCHGNTRQDKVRQQGKTRQHDRNSNTSTKSKPRTYLLSRFSRSPASSRFSSSRSFCSFSCSSTCQQSPHPSGRRPIALSLPPSAYLQFHLRPENPPIESSAADHQLQTRDSQNQFPLLLLFLFSSSNSGWCVHHHHHHPSSQRRCGPIQDIAATNMPRYLD